MCTGAYWPTQPELIPVFMGHEAKRSIITAPWIGCKSIERLSSAFHQTSPKIRRYPFILRVGERQCESEVFCPRHADHKSRILNFTFISQLYNVYNIKSLLTPRSRKLLYMWVDNKL